MKKIMGIVITGATGLIVLAGYFFQEQLGSLLSLIINWGVLLVGAAGLIGVGYLLRQHLLKMSQRKAGAFQSGVVLFAFFSVFLAGLLLPPQSVFYRNLILNIQIPVEASLLSILTITLLFGSFRLIRSRGWTPLSVAFLMSLITFLIFDLGFIQTRSGTLGAELIGFLNRLPLAGARGILLGLALGGLVVGLRFIFTSHRPFGE